MKKIFLIFISVISLLFLTTTAEAGIVSSIKILFSPKPKPKMLKVKTIPQGAACNPSSATQNCNTKN